MSNKMKLLLTLIFILSFCTVALAEQEKKFMHIAGKLSIGGSLPKPGDEVRVYNSKGTLVGVHIIDESENGYYGDLPIKSGGPKEGAHPGEKLTVTVWSVQKSKEYGENQTVLTTTSDLLAYGYQPATFPLTFQPRKFFGLNISLR